MSKTQIFRELHTGAGGLLILPNVWDAAGARIVESLGAKAIATTSGGVAWAKGYPDGNILPAGLQAKLAKEIVDAVNIPVTIDFEAGYSDDPATVAENLKPLIDAGIAGINLEDGTASPDLLARKIETIKKTSDLFINARTDVYLQDLVPDDQKVGETLSRAAAYQTAGADGLFVPALTEPAAIAEIVSGTDLPLNLLSVPGLPTAERLTNLKVRRLSAGTALAQIAYHHVARLAKSFLVTGDFETFNEDSMTYPEFQTLFERT